MWLSHDDVQLSQEKIKKVKYKKVEETARLPLRNKCSNNKGRPIFKYISYKTLKNYA